MKYLHTFALSSKLLLILPMVVSIIWPAIAISQSYADTSSISCVSLTAAPASDGSQYNFTAKASGNGTITGYAFDFGDKQSYSFSFSNDAQQNRKQATVLHTYSSPGIYAASVHVEMTAKGNTTSTTSRNCRATVSDGPTTLVDTGTGNAPELFAAAFLSGVLVSEIWFLRHQVHLH